MVSTIVHIQIKPEENVELNNSFSNVKVNRQSVLVERRKLLGVNLKKMVRRY